MPPLILQPLVENAIKHGVARTADAGDPRIVVAREEDARLLARPSRTTAAAGAPDMQGGGTGVGLINVGDRLAARFGAEGELRRRAACPTAATRR